MTPLARLSGRLERLSGRLLLFAPVCLGAGVGSYFSLPEEPGPLAWTLITLAAAGLAALAWHFRRSRFAGLSFLAAGAAVVLAGLLVAGLRNETVRAPVLEFRYYGPVEGRVVKIDRSASEAVRLTLDRVRLDRVAPRRIPERVRVSLHGVQGYLDPEPGQRVAMTAFLSGPEGPVEPGGFDFRRMAWFERIGAVGYTRAPALLLAPPEGRGEVLVSRLRARISAWVLEVLPNEAGTFATAITTGDRSAMNRETVEALRGSNLAHLLAISGLHMGLLTGFVFTALRYALALVPGLADRLAIRKVAAVVALQAGAFYLALSGGNVATERAFIMVAVMFGAVLMDRRALTLRAVALAALAILLVQPESLTSPGFQMSFAATTALVAVFGYLRDWPAWNPPRILRGPVSLVIASSVAGIATAPFAAAHFNIVSHYGLLANLAAVPVMGTLVMPLAVLAAVLAPLGLGWLALEFMQYPILWILTVARFVTGLDGAVGHVPSPGPEALPLITIGGLALVLLAGRWRLAGIAPVVLALGLWAGAERPAALISPGGGLVGVLTPEGRVLSKPRGDGFAARVWLENDGDPVAQDVAHARRGFRGEAGAREIEIGGLRVVHLTGRGARERVAGACLHADLVVLSMTADAVPTGCRLFDEAALEATGALALYPDGTGFRVVSATERSGARSWTGR
ncbi:ComEC/Rec2 family competence protein [Maritimibacter sp. HL-12]|uniref:ComEC/Rec2 family competence protein n=1 Tax=Maritimibacter sp. HL-12 TaxID=1162418 RepID=UPI000A0F30A2|nr:ComEC/Rec2 family competence protein [Maritimibacter sp. HL-12]SMH58014.1 competence protein ComEC [Maritimibacter sp. HL-12]